VSTPLRPSANDGASAASSASHALTERLRDLVFAAVADSLGLDSAEVRAKLGDRLDEILRAETRNFVERLDRSERLAHVGQLSSSAVHELRNPLSVIETSAFVIAERAHSDPRIARHAKRIAEQVSLAGHIISDLLDAARGRPLHPVPVDTATLVRGAIEQLSRERAALVTVDVASPAPRVSGDERRLRQVIVNLLTNAFEATGERGPVHVVVVDSAETVVIHVRDGGPGLSPTVIARLFEPLVTTKSHGTGLGLALSREIVSAHGGELRAFNLAEGGACFEVVLAASADSKNDGVR
jgi:signal transduction histidine kinase